MLRFYALYLWSLLLLIVVVMIRDHMRRRVDVLSWRNFFLLGLGLFQFHSGARSLWDNEFDQFPIDDPVGSGFEFILMSTVFLALFFWVYHKGWLADAAARKTPATRSSPQDTSLMFIAVAMCVLAYVSRLGLTRIPSLQGVANIAGIGFAGVSAATIGWASVRHLRNPIQVVLAVALVAANMVVVLYSSFGRRPLFAVFIALIWGGYYSHLRFKSSGVMFTRVLPALLVPLLLVAVFTSVREHSFHVGSPVQVLTAMVERGSVKAGLGDLASGQATGAAAMWAIEKWPEEFETRHLFTLRYAVLMYVPRNVWPDKPYPLSTYAADYAEFKGVRLGRDGVTIPVGIVGYAAAEGGWYALFVYAAFLAMLCRYGDSMTKLHPLSPFVILPLGCQLGQILGLARGETSAFLTLLTIGVVGTYALYLIVGRLVTLFVEPHARPPQVSPLQPSG